MKNVLFILSLVALMSSCTKSNRNVDISPDSVSISHFKFTDYYSRWNTLSLEGKDTVISGYAERIQSVGLWVSDSAYGRFIYRGDTFRISVKDVTDVPVQESSLTGWYKTVVIQKPSGSSWSGKLGVYQYKLGRYFYRLDVTPTTYLFSSRSYVDSL